MSPNHHWYIKSKSPDGKIRVSWTVEDVPHTKIFDTIQLAEEWISKQMGKEIE